MAAGFTAPGVVFLGSIDRNTQDYLAGALPKLRDQGYTRLVEPCAGSLAISMIAKAGGWPTDSIEASDVSLFSAVCGAVINGDTDLHHLDVQVDGQPLELGDNTSPQEQGALILWAQLILRHETKAHIDYWRAIVDNLKADRITHVERMTRQLTNLAAALRGVRYESLDLYAHMDRVADDPHTVVAISPPTYAAGYEKFFDTDGRLTWAEPEYPIFDPDGGAKALYDRYRDAKMLVLQYEECQPRQTVSGRPVFGQALTGKKNCYINANRVDEVLALQGGRPQTAVRARTGLEAGDVTPMPADHQVTDSSKVEIVAVGSKVADYYRQLWTHRLTADPGPLNAIVVVDGYGAGVVGWSIDTMMRPMPGSNKFDRYILLRYASAPYHETLRLGRLATMLALRRDSVVGVAQGPSLFYVTASIGTVTVEMTRHPEAKGLRGLMKMQERQEHPDGYKLFYTALWTEQTAPETLRAFLTKESQWRKARAKAASSKSPTG